VGRTVAIATRFGAAYCCCSCSRSRHRSRPQPATTGESPCAATSRASRRATTTTRRAGDRPERRRAADARRRPRDLRYRRFAARDRHAAVGTIQASAPRRALATQPGLVQSPNNPVALDAPEDRPARMERPALTRSGRAASASTSSGPEEFAPTKHRPPKDTGSASPPAPAIAFVDCIESAARTSATGSSPTST
jgi:hypothetical protein